MSEDTLASVKKSRPRKYPPICSVPDCGLIHYAKGYCKKHNTQVSRHGRLTPERERNVVRTCKVEKCGRHDVTTDLCKKHARQVRIHGRLTPEREHIMGNVGCIVVGCKKPHRSKGYCTKHYNQMRWQKIASKIKKLEEIEKKEMK